MMVEKRISNKQRELDASKIVRSSSDVALDVRGFFRAHDVFFQDPTDLPRIQRQKACVVHQGSEECALLLLCGKPDLPRDCPGQLGRQS